MPSSHVREPSGEDASLIHRGDEEQDPRFLDNNRRRIIKSPFNAEMDAATRAGDTGARSSTFLLRTSKPTDIPALARTQQVPGSDITQAWTSRIPTNKSGSGRTRASIRGLQMRVPGDEHTLMPISSLRENMPASETITPLFPVADSRRSNVKSFLAQQGRPTVTHSERQAPGTLEFPAPLTRNTLVPSPTPPSQLLQRSRVLTPIKPVHLLSASKAGDSVSLLDTISMVAVQPREEEGQQQDIFIANRVEDIALKETRPLPVIQTNPSQPMQEVRSAKHRAVSSIAGGAALGGAGDLVFAVLRYLTNVIMTHIVSPATFGIFVEANTVVSVVGYAGKLGLDNVVLRFLAVYRAQSEADLAAGIVRFTLWVSLIFGLICGGLFFAFSAVLAHVVYQRDVYTLPFKEAALLVPLIGLQLVISSGLQALKEIKWKVYVDRLIQPALTLALLGTFYLLGLRLEALIFATICGYFASTVVGQLYLMKAIRKIAPDPAPRYERKAWMRFALPMFFNSMIRNILNSTDVLFLGALATTANVGLYGAADRVSYFVVMPLIALNVIFSPVIAEYHTHGQHQQLANMFKVVTKWSFSLSWPFFLCCLIFHDPILGIFGEKYIAAGPVLIVLAFGNLVDAGVGSVNYLLVMTGRPFIILVNTIATVVVNVSLATLLIPYFSILGAAVAAALTVIILNIVGLIEVYWILRIHPYRWDTLKPVVAGFVASLVGYPLFRVIHVDYGHTAILEALAMIIPFMLVYLGTLGLLRFSEEDIMVFDTVRSKFGRKKSA